MYLALKKTKKSSLSSGEAALTFCGALYISGKLPTYPSPKPTLTLTSHLKENVGGGVGGQFLRNLLWSHFACPLPLLACHSKWFSYKITCLGPCPLGNLGKKLSWATRSTFFQVQVQVYIFEIRGKKTQNGKKIVKIKHIIISWCKALKLKSYLSKLPDLFAESSDFRVRNISRIFMWHVVHKRVNFSRKIPWQNARDKMMFSSK